MLSFLIYFTLQNITFLKLLEQGRQGDNRAEIDQYEQKGANRSQEVPIQKISGLFRTKAKKKKSVNIGHYVLPATPKGSARIWSDLDLGDLIYNHHNFLSKLES